MRGIPRSLARWRAARYRDVRYRLDLRVDRRARTLSGRLAIEVALTRPTRIVLDWRPPAGAAAAIERVNDVPLQLARDGDHLVVPAAATRAGTNRIEVRVRAPIRAAGAPVTRYRDREDGAHYIYTLLVPADASTLFPCFDQPDLKARITLAITHPPGWRVVSNAPAVVAATDRHAFADTAPISTYLFAFAAGPFACVDGRGPTRAILLRASQQRSGLRAARQALALADAATGYCARYTGIAFPFPQHVLVLVPEFQYGGMEHAGATFLREEAILLAPAASDAARLRRMLLVAHETAHQWFGDLVTMRWFDDLWIKEGFANFMAARIVEALDPSAAPRIALLAQKSAAYRSDATGGAHPLVARVPNLLDAKAAYGAIVYQKAPAVLRMTERLLGEAAFRRAVRRWLAAHAYAAADRDDLRRALERAHGASLRAWFRAWIETAGVPRVRLRMSVTRERVVRSAWLERRDARAPLAFDLACVSAEGRRRRVAVRLVGGRARVPALEGRRMPRAVLLDPDDTAYARLEHDAQRLPPPDGTGTALWRARIVEANVQAMLDGALAPAALVARLLAALEHETHPSNLAHLLERLERTVRWFLPHGEREDASQRAEAALAAFATRAADAAQREAASGARIALTRSSEGRAWLARRLRTRDGDRHFDERLAIIERLAVLGEPIARARLAEERARARTDVARRRVFAAGTAMADTGVKARLLARFLDDPRLPESWIEAALPRFACPEHAALVLPLLEPALAALPRLEGRFRIFFVNRWIEAIVGGQHSPAALTTVRRIARTHEARLRAKLIEAADELATRIALRGEARGGRPSPTRYSSRLIEKL